MDRRERDRHDRYDDRTDYGRYEGYNRDDTHYHSARNLTNEFERDYQRERGHWGDDRYQPHMEHTYHEGDMGDAYERRTREDRNFRDYADRQRYGRDRNWNEASSLSRDRDRYSSSGDRFRADQDWRSSGRDQSRDYGNWWQDHGTSNRYDTDSPRSGQRYYDAGREDDRYRGRNYGSSAETRADRYDRDSLTDAERRRMRGYRWT